MTNETTPPEATQATTEEFEVAIKAFGLMTTDEQRSVLEVFAGIIKGWPEETETEFGKAVRTVIASGRRASADLLDRH